VITAIVVVLVVLVVLAATGAAASVRVLREYERAVVFRLGRLMEQRGPGLVTIVPGIDRMVRVSLRTVTLTVPPQEVITRDNVPVRVTAVAYYRVVDPNRAVVEVQSYDDATLQIAQTTLRSVLGGADLDTLLGEREHLNDDLQHVIDTHTEPWGIKVTAVEIKDVEIPERMQHAIARQAEAERERRAKIIDAEGEFQSAEKLSQAADVISQNPVTIQLRYLQTLREIGATQNSTVVFPIPIDLIKPAMDALARTSSPPGQAEESNGAGQHDNSQLPAAATLELSTSEQLTDEAANVTLPANDRPGGRARTSGGQKPLRDSLEISRKNETTIVQS
jgi:regulator of protease activity HflC (stomatin/prohibitin superfamily)